MPWEESSRPSRPPLRANGHAIYALRRPNHPGIGSRSAHQVSNRSENLLNLIKPRFAQTRFQLSLKNTKRKYLWKVNIIRSYHNY